MEMTIDKAIEDLKASKRWKCKPSNECIDVVIKALEQQSYEKFESVKDHIYKLAGDYKCWDNRLTEDEAVELCHMLEQETCEDTISRQAYIERYRKWSYSEFGRKIDNEALAIRVAMSLPPVTPQPKTGHWINKKPRWIPSLSMTIHDAYECSNCGEPGVHWWKHCINCGAEMIEPQEGGDKE